MLGLNGPAGSQSALANLQTMPGYQFTLGQGNNAINAAAAANGTLNSGNQAIALQNYGQGLAQQNYGNYVNQLAPFLGFGSNLAGGISGAYQNQGAADANIALATSKAEQDALAGYGSAQASGSLANQGFAQSLLGGLGGGVTSLLGAGLNGGLLGSGNSLLGKLFTASDERLKENIEPVGELFDGTNVYRYNYKGDGRTHIGLIAQEVAETSPDAVGEFGGFLAVDYGKASDYAAQLGGFLEAA